MKLFSLIPILFFFSSCLSAPKISLNENNALIWIENIGDKIAIDDYENIYRFNRKADMNVFIYGYSSAIKYKLFEVKGENRALYYTVVTLKSYIISSLPYLNLYELKLNSGDILMQNNSYFGSSDNFKDKKIYIAVGLIFEDNVLYMAKNYSSGYKEKLNLWIKNNGYFKNGKWHPISRADWNSYPVPTEDDIDWEELYTIGETV